MKKTVNYRNVIVGILCALSIVFVMLKAVGIINWGWVWCLSPILIPMIICFIVAVTIILWALITNALEK